MAEAWATPDLLQQEEGDVHDVTDEIEQATESMKVIKSRILSVFNKKRKSTEKKQKGQNSKPPSGRKATAADSVAKESVNKLLDLYNGWEDNLQCAICLSQFKDPLALTCLHSFCSRCLEMILINTKGTRASSSKYISCPTCRRPTYLGKGGGLERLVKNWYIDDIYEKIQKTQSCIGQIGDIHFDTEKFIACKDHNRSEAPYGTVCMKCIHDMSVLLEMTGKYAVIYDANQNALIKLKDHIRLSCPSIESLMEQAKVISGAGDECPKMQMHFPLPPVQPKVPRDTSDEKLLKLQMEISKLKRDRFHERSDPTLRPLGRDTPRPSEVSSANSRCIFSPTRENRNPRRSQTPDSTQSTEAASAQSRQSADNNNQGDQHSGNNLETQEAGDAPVRSERFQHPTPPSDDLTLRDHITLQRRRLRRLFDGRISEGNPRTHTAHEAQASEGEAVDPHQNCTGARCVSRPQTNLVRIDSGQQTETATGSNQSPVSFQTSLDMITDLLQRGGNGGFIEVLDRLDMSLFSLVGVLLDEIDTGTHSSDHRPALASPIPTEVAIPTPPQTPPPSRSYRPVLRGSGDRSVPIRTTEARSHEVKEPLAPVRPTLRSAASGPALVGNATQSWNETVTAANGIVDPQATASSVHNVEPEPREAITQGAQGNIGPEQVFESATASGGQRQLDAAGDNTGTRPKPLRRPGGQTRRTKGGQRHARATTVRSQLGQQSPETPESGGWMWKLYDRLFKQ